MVVVALLGIVINGIGITVGISYAYASVPISLGLVFYFLVVNYECKNTLLMGDNNRPETYFSFGFGELTSAHHSPVGRLDDPPEIQGLPLRKSGGASFDAGD
jgi:hypothetical protein